MITSHEFQQWQYNDIKFQHMNDDECLADFRVNRSELNALAETLVIPGQFCCPNGMIASGIN